jgi:hypothetical protein
MPSQFVTVLFEPRDAGAAIDFDRVRGVVTASGATDSEARIDARTGAMHVTFTSEGNPTPVVARLREELAGDWTLLGEASYASSEPAERPDRPSRWPALALCALALGVAICIVAGWVPYDFDESVLGYALATVLLGGPLCLAAYAAVRHGDDDRTP